MKTVFASAALIFIAALAAPVAGPAAFAHQSQTQWSGIYTEAQAKRGEATYGQNCRNCHGPTLLGAEGGPALIGADFDAVWGGRTIGELFEKIRATMPQTAPGSLTEREYADVLAFMLSAGKFPSGPSELASQPNVLNVIQYQARKP